MEKNYKGLLIGVAILVVGMAFTQFDNWRKSKPEEIAQEEFLGEEPLDNSPLTEPANNEVAISYLNGIISDAFTRGANNTLKQIISFVQKTNEDGTIEPICDSVTIGDIQLINIACLKQAEPLETNE